MRQYFPLPLLKSDLWPGQVVESRRSVYRATVLGDPKRRDRLAKAPRGKVAVRAPQHWPNVLDKTYWSLANIVPAGQGRYSARRKEYGY